ncbi:MAG: hypothetical protein L3J10_04300 [Sulfurimonas sp.]|nr:hypothetical protein [Sulfurimonas sp.]
MKTKILTLALLLIYSLTFIGCNEKKEQKTNDKINGNIATNSLFGTTKRLENCSMLVERHEDGYTPTQEEIDNKKRCAKNALKRRNEDKTYYYEINEKTKVMCRNIPHFFRQFSNDEEPYLLMNNDYEKREVTQAIDKIKGKQYFYIGNESVDLKNPVIKIKFTNFDIKLKRWFKQLLSCEIANPQDKYKKTYEEIH